MRFGSHYVPPEDFDQYRWLAPMRPEDAPRWYYWIERGSPHLGEFAEIDTIDSLLRPLVEYLYRRGIPTLPSCQGHFYSYDEVREQVEWLRDEAPSLQQGLLTLRDVENGTMLAPTIGSYRPPTPRDMAEDLFRYQGRGTIGIVFDDVLLAAHVRDIVSRHAREGVRVTGKNPVVHIHVRAVAPEDLVDAWQLVTRSIRRVM